jgi:hypothetical protein
MVENRGADFEPAAIVVPPKGTLNFQGREVGSRDVDSEGMSLLPGGEMQEPHPSGALAWKVVGRHRAALSVAAVGQTRQARLMAFR